MVSLFRLLIVGLALTLVAGCASRPPIHDPDYAPVLPEVTVPPQPTNGAIYQTGFGLSLYEDVKARNVGDIITVELVEQTDASKSASTSTSKDQGIDIGAGLMFGAPVTRNGRSILQSQIEAGRDFDGSGKANQSNSLSGSITVTVSQVLANGNLVVRGEKLLTLNQGDEFIRFTGIIRPVDVRSDNTVLSTKVANSRIIYSGRGSLNDANEMGWFARFFNSPLFPF